MFKIHTSGIKSVFQNLIAAIFSERARQADREYPKLKKSSRFGKFNSLIIKTYQIFKILQVGKIGILGHPVRLCLRFLPYSKLNFLTFAQS